MAVDCHKQCRLIVQSPHIRTSFCRLEFIKSNLWTMPQNWQQGYSTSCTLLLLSFIPRAALICQNSVFCWTVLIWGQRENQKHPHHELRAKTNVFTRTVAGACKSGGGAVWAWPLKQRSDWKSEDMWRRKLLGSGLAVHEYDGIARSTNVEEPEPQKRGFWLEFATSNSMQRAILTLSWPFLVVLSYYIYVYIYIYEYINDIL